MITAIACRPGHSHSRNTLYIRSKTNGIYRFNGELDHVQRRALMKRIAEAKGQCNPKYWTKVGTYTKPVYGKKTERKIDPKVRATMAKIEREKNAA